MTRNKDFFRKPYMETPEDDYSDMMKYIPDAAQPDYRSKPHSEMLKPYDDRIRDYEGMEHFEPSNFKIPEWPPSIDADPTGGGEPKIPADADCFRFKIEIEGPDKVSTQGIACYIAILYYFDIIWESLGQIGGVRWSASSTTGFGGFADKPIQDDGCLYVAPEDCAIVVEAEVDCDKGHILKASKNVEGPMWPCNAVCPPIDGVSIIGSDAPTDGECYSLDNWYAGIEIVWAITKGSIDSSGCVSGLSGECGVATITATFMCKDNEIVATKQVRMPLGVWIDYTFDNYIPCNDPADTCTSCSITETSGIYRTTYTNGRYNPNTLTGNCPEDIHCTPATSGGCPTYTAIRLANKDIDIWSCP